MSKAKFSEVMQLYLNGSMEDIDWRIEMRQGKALWSNLENPEDLIPMLQSPFESAQYQACYIISEDSKDVTNVLDYIMALFRSPFSKVRDLACDIMQYNGKINVHFAEIIKCLKDSDRAVRLKANIALRSMDKESIIEGNEVVRQSGYFILSQIFDKYIINEPNIADLNPSSMSKTTRLEKHCYYVGAMRAGLSEEELKPFVRAIREPDLTFRHRK
jgi:hypothetical protein